MAGRPTYVRLALLGDLLFLITALVVFTAVIFDSSVLEFALFSLLAGRRDSVFQRPEIFETIWGNEMPRRNRSVDVLVRKVRGKLEEVAPDWRYIHTHFGIGYRFSPEQVR